MLVIDEFDKEFEINNYKFSCPASVNLKITKLENEKVFLILIKENQKHICCKGRNLDGNNENFFEIAQKMVKLGVKYKELGEIKGIIKEFSDELNWEKIKNLIDVAEEENKKKITKLKLTNSEVSSDSVENSLNIQTNPLKSNNLNSELSESSVIPRQTSNIFSNKFEIEDFIQLESERNIPNADVDVIKENLDESNKGGKDDKKLSGLKLMLAKRNSIERKSLVGCLPYIKIPPFIPKIKNLNIEKPAFKAMPNVNPVSPNLISKIETTNLPREEPSKIELVEKSISSPINKILLEKSKSPVLIPKNSDKSGFEIKNLADVYPEPIFLNDSEKELKIKNYLSKLNFNSSKTIQSKDESPSIVSLSSEYDQSSLKKGDADPSDLKKSPVEPLTPQLDSPIPDSKPQNIEKPEPDTKIINNENAKKPILMPPPLLPKPPELIIPKEKKNQNPALPFHSPTFPDPNSSQEINFNIEFNNPDLPVPTSNLNLDENLYPFNFYQDYLAATKSEILKIEPKKELINNNEILIDLPRIPPFNIVENDSIAYNPNLPNHLKLQEEKKEEQKIDLLGLDDPKEEVKSKPENFNLLINAPDLFSFKHTAENVLDLNLKKPEEIKNESVVYPIVSKINEYNSDSITLSQVLYDKNAYKLDGSNKGSDFYPRSSVPYMPGIMHPDLPPWPDSEPPIAQIKQPNFVPEISANYQAVHFKPGQKTVISESQKFANTKNTKFMPYENISDSSSDLDSSSSSEKILYKNSIIDMKKSEQTKKHLDSVQPQLDKFKEKKNEYDILHEENNFIITPNFDSMCSRCLEDGVDLGIILNCECINCLNCLQECFLSSNCIKCRKPLTFQDYENLKVYFPDY